MIEKIAFAREFSLEGTRDILNFICLTLIYQDNFDHDAGLQDVLSRVKDRTITMDQAMEELEELAEES